MLHPPELYRNFSTYTYPGCYAHIIKNLPNDVKQIGTLLSKSVIHRNVLKYGNTKFNANMTYGDMNEVPWWRLRCEDDIFPTSSAMLAELLRLDPKGLTTSRRTADKIIVTCRQSSILMASALKTKGYPARVRAVFVPYIFSNNTDHWIVQYWNRKWINVDIDICLENKGFDAFNVPEDIISFPAQIWLKIRKNKLNANNFNIAGKTRGVKAVLAELMYDFHCIMNDEIIYNHVPDFMFRKSAIKPNDLKDIDILAKLMIYPDRNFHQLAKIWETQKKFRILSGSLIHSSDHK